MEPSSDCKIYHQHDFDHRQFLHAFCTPGADAMMFKELILSPMKAYHKLLKPGNILMDFTFGPFLSHLLLFCDLYSEIIVLEPNDLSVKELEKWLKEDEESLDCSCSLTFMEEMGIGGNLIEKQKILRKKITRVEMFNLNADDPPERLAVPKADCLLDGYLLEHVSQDKAAYCRNLKTLASLVRLGGYFVFLGTFDAKHFCIGNSRFHVLDYDEEFFRNCAKEAGLRLEFLNVTESQAQNDMFRYNNIWFAIACKEREV
ncbi:nicotinamide N-methyltransferase-like [Gastrophryne carolinensis]